MRLASSSAITGRYSPLPTRATGPATAQHDSGKPAPTSATMAPCPPSTPRALATAKWSASTATCSTPWYWSRSWTSSWRQGPATRSSTSTSVPPAGTRATSASRCRARLRPPWAACSNGCRCTGSTERTARTPSWPRWTRPEMDCAVAVSPDGSSARTLPMHRARRGDRVVVGMHGVRVARPGQWRGNDDFAFMTSQVSSEKPKGLTVERVAASIRRARTAGPDGRLGKVLMVCGPAVVHTGAAPAVAALVRGGWVQVLFAGNGFATHDIESAVLGTSLGAPLGGGQPSEHGHANHLRVINEVRRWGSIAAAVGAGWLRSGALYECVKAGVPFVLAGSVRDDGPLPDVVTDTVAAADAMRGQLEGVQVAVMLASTLHAIATGNLLPASVETFCVDINPAVVTKLADRGSRQALGIVTDVGLFAHELAGSLCGPSWQAQGPHGH